MTEVVWANGQDELNAIIASNSNVVIKFTAPSWCVPCQKFAPHFSKAAESTDGITFVAVDIDENPWVTSEYGVRGVPTVIQIVDSTRRDIKSRAVVPLIRELTS